MYDYTFYNGISVSNNSIRRNQTKFIIKLYICTRSHVDETLYAEIVLFNDVLFYLRV